jgi:ribosomal protein S12 methylthiotransferase
MTTVSLINLGCPKNLVDSEIMLGLLKKSGIKISTIPESADILCINTCAFIKEAKEESIDSIFQMVDLKKQNPRKKIIVIGCIVQRYAEALKKEIPEVDRWVGINKISILPEIIASLKHKKTKRDITNTATQKSIYDTNPPRKILTPKHYAYIKIAEGCSNRCSYCVIPDIRGNYKSRNPDSILREAAELAKKGVKEINIIAQDTTNYGSDLSSSINITLLLREICKIKDIKWIRLLYTHPAHITDSLIKEIASQNKICKYIDMPLQHIDDDLLLKMGRKTKSKHIKSLIKKIRKEIPGVILRTSFIVGFPGETEKQFQTLLKFIKKIKFDKLGIFKYSREEGTPAYKMKAQIPPSIKEKRYNEAMQLQKSISKNINKKFLGRKTEVLIEKIHDKKSNIWIGRTYADAPDVDGITYISGNNIKKGDIIMAKITGTLEYDLVGEKV